MRITSLAAFVALSLAPFTATAAGLGIGDPAPDLTVSKWVKGEPVKSIGVSVWEQDQKLIEPFVKEMGHKMEYRVAVDDVPEGKDGNDGKMALAWMKAAEANGIPTAFIVQDRKVAWIGHPMEMDGP